MTQQPTNIGVVRLARDSRRLLVLPVLAIFVGFAGAAASRLVTGPVSIALAVAGLLVAVVGGYLGAWLLSFRLEIEVGALRVRWLGGERRYQLVRGTLTRVVTRGPGAAALRPRLGVLGLGLGPAILRGEEHVELLRLGDRDSMVLVPTDRGRLAITAAVEQELLDALATAVLRQRELDAARGAAAAAAPAQPVSLPEIGAAPPPADVSPTRVLTGIERRLLESRLAAEREATRAAAEAERREAAGVGGRGGRASAANAAPAAAPITMAARARQRRASQWQRPSWLALPAWMTRWPRLLDAIPIVAPLVVAAGAWIVLVAGGRLAGPDPEARYLVMVLALTGPLAAAAVFIARSWQPRLTGLISWSALAAQVLLARALIN